MYVFSLSRIDEIMYNRTVHRNSAYFKKGVLRHEQFSE